MSPADRDALRNARRALTRMRRAVEKAGRELEAVEDSLREAEDDEVPAHALQEAYGHLQAVRELIEEQAAQLQKSMLRSSGITPDDLDPGGRA